MANDPQKFIDTRREVASAYQQQQDRLRRERAYNADPRMFGQNDPAFIPDTKKRAEIDRLGADIKALNDARLEVMKAQANGDQERLQTAMTFLSDMHKKRYDASQAIITTAMNNNAQQSLELSKLAFTAREKKKDERDALLRGGLSDSIQQEVDAVRNAQTGLADPMMDFTLVARLMEGKDPETQALIKKELEGTINLNDIETAVAAKLKQNPESEGSIGLMATPGYNKDTDSIDTRKFKPGYLSRIDTATGAISTDLSEIQRQTEKRIEEDSKYIHGGNDVKSNLAYLAHMMSKDDPEVRALEDIAKGIATGVDSQGVPFTPDRFKDLLVEQDRQRIAKVKELEKAEAMQTGHPDEIRLKQIREGDFYKQWAAERNLDPNSEKSFGGFLQEMQKGNQQFERDQGTSNRGGDTSGKAPIPTAPATAGVTEAVTDAAATLGAQGAVPAAGLATPAVPPPTQGAAPSQLSPTSKAPAAAPVDNTAEEQAKLYEKQQREEKKKATLAALNAIGEFKATGKSA